MTVYVDDMYRYEIGRYGRMKMSHIVADSRDELLAAADAIGLDRKWIQKAGTYREHFDVSKAKRALAIENGAVEVTMRELYEIIERRRGAGYGIDAAENP